MFGRSCAGAAPPPAVLLQSYKCYICHTNDESKTGPAYADVAARYRNNPRAVSILIATIKKAHTEPGRGIRRLTPKYPMPTPENGEYILS